jgi:hypothetical protein
MRTLRRNYWLIVFPTPRPMPPLDHFGPHNLVEWVIWVGAIVIVGIIAWRVVNRRLPPD